MDKFQRGNNNGRISWKTFPNMETKASKRNSIKNELSSSELKKSTALSISYFDLICEPNMIKRSE